VGEGFLTHPCHAHPQNAEVKGCRGFGKEKGKKNEKKGTSQGKKSRCMGGIGVKGKTTKKKWRPSKDRGKDQDNKFLSLDLPRTAGATRRDHKGSLSGPRCRSHALASSRTSR